jgi:penicillin G amidase
MIKIRQKTNTAVELSRNKEGVVFIEATGLAELYWGMGYCHAMDRGLQMLLTRILGQGRACECLTDSEEMLGIDRFFRRMNWSGRMNGQFDSLDPETLGLVQNYCAGVNAKFKKKFPWELKLLGVEYEPWRVEDVLLMTRMIGYINLAQSQGDLERLFLEMVQAGVDNARLDSLFPGAMDEVDRDQIERLSLGERIVDDKAAWGVLPRAMASNNWVVHGSRTVSGKPIMANDPHLEVNRLPSVWCEQVFKTPSLSLVAATMPGIPGPLIGRSRYLAWGATYTFMDAVDSWMEDCRDGGYRRGESFVPFEVRRERIKRKKEEDVEVVFYENQHGVLDGDPAVEGLYLATRWSSSESGALSLIAAKEMWSAQTVQEGMAASGKIETAWNWVFADSHGDIGYQMSGLMPIRPPSWSGFVPAPGWDSEYDWQGFVPVHELPRCINPKEGFIVTANQDLNHFAEVDPINAPMGAYRADRIADRLQAAQKVDVALCMAIQNDVFSLHAEEFLEFINVHLESGESPFADWDFTYSAESTQATTFESVYHHLRRSVFGEAGLGSNAVDTLLDETGIFTDFYDHFDRVLLDTESPWWDGLDPQTVIRGAVAKALQESPKTWGEQNSVVMRHILFGGVLPRFAGFDRGPIQLKGGRATPNQGQVFRAGGRETSFAPSIRMVSDLASSSIHTALAGGASDRRFSKWYTSDLKRWLAGEYKEIPLP